MSRMSRTSIARAALRTAATADTVEIAETGAGAEDVRVVADVDEVAVADEVAVVDVTAVAMADTAAAGTNTFRPRSAPTDQKIKGPRPSVAALFVFCEQRAEFSRVGKQG